VSAIVFKKSPVSMAIFAAGVVMSVLLVVGLLSSQMVSAFNDKATGDRLLNEYKQKCRSYDPSKKEYQKSKWERCKKVRTALVQHANCDFGKRATNRALTACAQKIESKFGASAATRQSAGQSTQDEIDLKPIQNIGVNEDNTQDGTTINSIKNIIFSLAGGLALLFVVIGGVRYVISRGDPGATAQAQSTIIYALVGLVVTVLAYAIVGFVVNSLF